LEKAKGEPRSDCANHLFDGGYVTLVFASKHFGRRWAAAEAFSCARGLFTPHGHQRPRHGTARHGEFRKSVIDRCRASASARAPAPASARIAAPRFMSGLSRAHDRTRGASTHLSAPSLRVCRDAYASCVRADTSVSYNPRNIFQGRQDRVISY